tara:strand:- start:583 stop:693 length:111 start_codon:yes stop_codon:yes gene_type:complete
MQGAQYGQITWFIFIFGKKKPPANAVVNYFALAGFI